MNRVISLSATVIIMALAIAATASAVSAGPPYISADGHTLGIQTNTHWTGAREILRSEMGQEEGDYIWASHCAPGTQTVDFTRKIELLGVPSEVHLAFDQFAEWRPAITSFQFLVNGHVVFRKNRDLSGDILDLTHAQAKAFFRLGVNDLELKAKKAKLPASVPACNTGATATALALYLGMRGTFQADLRSGQFAAANRYYPSAGGKRVALHLHGLAVANKGPDAVLGGYFRLATTNDYAPDGIFFITGFTGCKEHTSGIYSWEDCPFGKLDPGKSIPYMAGIFYHPPGDAFEHDATVTITVFNLQNATGPCSGDCLDPKSGNDTHTLTLHFCATNVDCTP
jgi:hypothetical protein